MKLKSRGLGRKELTMDFREYVVRREGHEIVIQGTIREPVHWDFAIRMSEDDLAGVARVALQRPTIALLVRAMFKRNKRNHWSVDRKTHIEQATAALKEQVEKAAQDAAKAKEAAVKEAAKAKEAAVKEAANAKEVTDQETASANETVEGQADADGGTEVTELASRGPRSDQRLQAQKAREALEARKKARAQEAAAAAGDADATASVDKGAPESARFTA